MNHIDEAGSLILNPDQFKADAKQFAFGVDWHNSWLKLIIDGNYENKTGIYIALAELDLWYSEGNGSRAICCTNFYWLYWEWNDEVKVKNEE